MRGYKIFYSDWLNDHNGFFCLRAIDCLNYENYTSRNTYTEVECDSDYKVESDKVLCKEFKIIRKLTYGEFGKLIPNRIIIKSGNRSCSYVDRILQGQYKEYYDGGSLHIQTTYKNGKLHGYYKTWYINGQLQNECVYVDGNQNGLSRSWRENGKLWLEYSFVNDTENGIAKEWDIDGDLLSEYTFVDGVECGVYRQWNKGRLELEYTLKDGEIHGIYREWDEDGYLTESLWIDGQQQDTDEEDTEN